jgi:hypothetical protein
MTNSPLGHLEAVVDSGRAVISADDQTIVAIVQDTINSGRTATFYLSAAQSNYLRSWFFTPDRIAALGIDRITPGEAERITSELGIQNVESFRCNRIQCECGQLYGAFEFLQQGIREHGPEVVRAVFALDNFTMVNANRTLVEVCPNCNRALADANGGFTYDCDHYGGCCYEEV